MSLRLCLVSCFLHTAHPLLWILLVTFPWGEVDSLCRAQLHGEDWDPVQVARALRC